MDVAAVMATSDWNPFQKLGRASASKLDTEGVCLYSGASNELCIDLLLSELNDARSASTWGGRILINSCLKTH